MMLFLLCFFFLSHSFFLYAIIILLFYDFSSILFLVNHNFAYYHFLTYSNFEYYHFWSQNSFHDLYIYLFFLRSSTWEPLDPSIATASSTQWRRPTVWWAWRKAGPNAALVLSFAPWWWKGKNDIFLIFSFKASAFDFLDAPVERVTGRDIPMPYALNLETKTIPQTENIVNAVRKACAGMKKK